jgi:hypothetical protein
MSGTPHLKIAAIDRLGGDDLIVGYSDASSAVYSVEQLVSLTPRHLGVRPQENPSLSARFFVSYS